MLMAGFQGMLRASEMRNLEWANMTATPIDSQHSRQNSTFWAFRFRMRDKTHFEATRTTHARQTEAWRGAAAWLAKEKLHRTHTGQGQHDTILSTAAWAALKAALRVVNLTPGCIRPSGHMFWLERGMHHKVIHKLGGWAPNSLVPSRHYTSVSGNILAAMDTALSHPVLECLPEAPQVEAWTRRWHVDQQKPR